jgi:hypothetical protein
LHVLLFIAFIFLAYKWGDWKNWENYYPTILYFGFFDLVFSCVYHDMPLWVHKCTIGVEIPHTIISLAWIIIIYPTTVLVYLYHFPKGFKKDILYISLWVIFYTAMELILYLARGIEYHNNWTILASLLFNCGMFTILWLHHKSRKAAWFITLLMSVIFIQLYKIPLTLIK